MPLPSKKQSHSFGTKKRSLRSKLQLARAAKEKVRTRDDESRHHAVPRAEAGDLELVPGPSMQADDQHDTSHEVIICDYVIE